jgi:hypothetical protein
LPDSAEEVARFVLRLADDLPCSVGSLASYLPDLFSGFSYRLAGSLASGTLISGGAAFITAA